MSTSHRTIKWIENLADQELRIRSGETVSIDLCTTKDEVLALESGAFLRDLITHLEYLIGLFNAKVVEEPMQIRLQREEAPVSLALTRKELKLVLHSPQPGVVQVQCDKFLSPDGPGRPPRMSMMFSARVEAKFGNFHDVEWFFLGNRVTAELLARHYLTEFIQVSRPDH